MLIPQITTLYVKKYVNLLSGSITNTPFFTVLYYYFGVIIMRYSVHCPSASFENSSFINLEDCWGLCLDLSEEYGYAEVRYGNCVLGSYTNGG